MPLAADRTLPKGATIETDPRLPPVVSYTLANGFRLLILEKRFVPAVSFTMFFKVGNADCRPGKTGLAHLFEHMAFKGTTTINSAGYEREKPALDRVEAAAQALIAAESSGKEPAGKLEALRAELDRAQEAADALSVSDEYLKIYNSLGESGLNAMTSADYTVYVVSLPSNRLEAWMRLESDRFKNPVLREFYRERDVVLEERRMGESDPNRVIWEALLSSAFDEHPYRNPTIGWPEDVRRLTRTDAENFYRAFYTPDNATLAVTGDVDPAVVIALAERYFGDWRRGGSPDRSCPAEPPQNREKLRTVVFNAAPALRIGFRNPGMGHPDIYPLIMAGETLSGGKTGRFYRNLVEGRQLALYAWAGASTPGNRYPSLFVVAAAPKAPHTAAELDAAIMEEIERLAAEPPTRWELDRTLNNYQAEMIKQLESNTGLGMSLAQNESLMGDWRFDWKAGEQLRRVTPEDVSAAAAGYLTRANRTAVFLGGKETA
ncbi:MAG: pitrilysin family protein [Elusimicrobia bacterium]|nr:pitrilysin family protein [Elusimicrobiota bacterium]